MSANKMPEIFGNYNLRVVVQPRHDQGVYVGFQSCGNNAQEMLLELTKYIAGYEMLVKTLKKHQVKIKSFAEKSTPQ